MPTETIAKIPDTLEFSYANLGYSAVEGSSELLEKFYADMDSSRKVKRGELERVITTDKPRLTESQMDNLKFSVIADNNGVYIKLTYGNRLDIVLDNNFVPVSGKTEIPVGWKIKHLVLRPAEKKREGHRMYGIDLIPLSDRDNIFSFSSLGSQYHGDNQFRQILLRALEGHSEEGDVGDVSMDFLMTFLHENGHSSTEPENADVTNVSERKANFWLLTVARNLYRKYDNIFSRQDVKYAREWVERQLKGYDGDNLPETQFGERLSRRDIINFKLSSHMTRTSNLARRRYRVAKQRLSM